MSATPKIVRVFDSTAGVEPEWCATTHRWGGAVVNREQSFSFVLIYCNPGVKHDQWLGLLLSRGNEDFRFARPHQEEVTGWDDVERIVVANFRTLAEQFETTSNPVLADDEYRVELVSSTSEPAWREEEEDDFSPLALIRKVGYPPFFLHQCAGDYECQDYEVLRTLSLEGVATLGRWRAGGPTHSCQSILGWLHATTDDSVFEYLHYQPELARAILAGEHAIRVTRTLTPQSDVHRVGKSLTDTARHLRKAVVATIVLPSGEQRVCVIEPRDDDQRASQRLEASVAPASGPTETSNS